MKKTLILASLMAFVSMPAVFADEQKSVPQRPALERQKPEVKHQSHRFDKQKFEERLKLTDEQKVQAKELRKASFEKMKPIMEEMKLKKEEIGAVKRSKIAVEEQEVKIAKIREELKVLHKQAHEIRMQNMKDFEALLTKKQKKELAKMKKEGRKKFEKDHKRKGHPEFKPGFKSEFGPALPPKSDK